MTETQESTFADIKKTTETDPKAADSALQGLVCNSEGEAPEAPPDTEDLESVLGDLEADAGKAPEVIEHLDELDAYAEDTAKAKAKARSAAMLAAYATANAAAKAEARLVQEPTPALRPNTATPAVQAVMVAEKAESPSDLESLEHLLGDLGVGAGESDGAVIEDLSELDALAEDTPKGEGSVAATHAETAGAEKAERTDIENLDFALADLEVGADEADQVVEHLSELDAFAEAAAEAVIAKSEAYEDQPDEPTALTVAIQEYKARQPKRGAPRPAACKEFGIDPTDPMAVDKVRIAYELKKVGKTLADLEKYHPGFWALPLKTDDGSPSRKLVLSRFLWRRNDEIKAKEKAVERQKKREARGYPADYDKKTPAERKRITNRLAQQWRRERVKALKAAGPRA